MLYEIDRRSGEAGLFHGALPVLVMVICTMLGLGALYVVGQALH